MLAFHQFLRNFHQWDSESQKKSVLSLQQYLVKLGRLSDDQSVWAAIAYMIQKDHESQEWFVNLIGDHVKRLEDQIQSLKMELRPEAPKEAPESDTIAKLLDKVGEQDTQIKALQQTVANLSKTMRKSKDERRD